MHLLQEQKQAKGGHLDFASKTQYMTGVFIIVTVALVTRMSVIVADVVVLAITWYKAARTVLEARSLGIRVPISEILLRDG